VALVPAPVTRKPHAAGLHVAALEAADAASWPVSIAVPAAAPLGPAAEALLDSLSLREGLTSPRPT
jgi:hypothetical protein